MLAKRHELALLFFVLLVVGVPAEVLDEIPEVEVVVVEDSLPDVEMVVLQILPGKNMLPASEFFIGDITAVLRAQESLEEADALGVLGDDDCRCLRR